MKKIYFKSPKNWTCVFAVVYNKDESVSETVNITEQDEEGDHILKFDNEKYDHIVFLDSNGEKTGKIYTGDLSLGVEYKKNEKTGSDLTYLFSKTFKTTGKVDNYILEDVKNLAYREDRSKKISVFVPTGYDGKTPYDILYFFDAQNLFCGAGDYTESGDPYGSWQLDTVLGEIERQYGKKIIVVGIDNADKYRDRELFMDPADFGELAPMASLPDEDYHSGHLDRLCDFMKETLHPFIKERYCVSESNIGIGGASMGGIASFYCGLRELGFYKYVLSYSPAYGLYEMSAFENYFAGKNFAENASNLPTIHVYCGGGDPLEQMLLPASKAIKTALVRHGYLDGKIYETYDPDKPHNEESWRLILPQSFEYMLRGRLY